MRQHADEYSIEDRIEHVILDLPFFIQQLSAHDMLHQFLEDARFGFGLDTLQVARKGVQGSDRSVGIPSAYNLPTLFQFITGHPPELSHRAMADVKATISVFRYNVFWETRTQCLFSFRTDVNETPLGVPDDSDTSVSVNSRSGESNDAPSDGPANDDTETNDDDSSSPSGDRWEEDKDFRPTLPLPMQKCNEHFTSSGRS